MSPFPMPAFRTAGAAPGPGTDATAPSGHAPLSAAARASLRAIAAGRKAGALIELLSEDAVSPETIASRIWADRARPAEAKEVRALLTVVRQLLRGSGHRVLRLPDGRYRIAAVAPGAVEIRPGALPEVDARLLRGARVVLAGGRYRILAGDGQPLSGLMGSREHAVDMLDRMRRRAAHRTRPCLTCATPFLSEGAHHRMCASCRHRRSGGWLNGENAR